LFCICLQEDEEPDENGDIFKRVHSRPDLNTTNTSISNNINSPNDTTSTTNTSNITLNVLNTSNMTTSNTTTSPQRYFDHRWEEDEKELEVGEQKSDEFSDYIRL
jgi:vesicle coat complex subunit